ncbi:MAG TPA: hypothetical protein VN496_01765 [Burkholderiales bacterium]|nr:hypothetical protein [Burkholderiales bacterium]
MPRPTDNAGNAMLEWRFNRIYSKNAFPVGSGCRSEAKAEQSVIFEALNL